MSLCSPAIAAALSSRSACLTWSVDCAAATALPDAVLSCVTRARSFVANSSKVVIESS